jgi:HlyD family secretion protein
VTGLSAVPERAEPRRVSIRDTAAQDEVIRQPPGAGIKRLAIVAVLLAVFAGSIIFAWQSWNTADRTVSRARLRTAVVERGDFTRDISAQGQIVAAIKPTVFATADGTVTLHAQAGDVVQQGDVIAIIESPELANQLEQEQSTLQSLEVDLARENIETRKSLLAAEQKTDLARVRIKAAERELRRAEQSHAYQVISDQDLEKAKDDLENARLEYTHAEQDARLIADTESFEIRTRELERDRQTLQVAEAERLVDQLTIRSPVDGMIGDLAVEQKAAVARNQPMFTVIDLSAFETDLGIPEAYADDIGLGMDVAIRYGSETYPGTLSAISPEVQNNQVRARVRFTETVPPGLRQNQRVSATVLLEHKRDVINVKRGPFIDSGAGRVVYVVEDGIATRRAIGIGSMSIAAVEIAHGLEEGDTIVISSYDLFKGVDTVRLAD